MKSKILTIATCLTLGGFANAQNVNIPDVNFKNALVNHSPTIDANNDGDISTTEAQNFTGTINVSNSSISDLTGIEAFVNATKLYCQNNQLTSLNVSANTALTRLRCNNNQLTSLNVANGNNGTSASNLILVKATYNPNLTCIQHDSGFDPTTATYWYKDATASWSTNCSGSSCANIVNMPDANFKNALINHSPTIDTDGDGEICQTEAQAFTGIINVGSKSISDLTGIEAFVNLTELYCGGNQLTSLDVSANTALTVLYCNSNQLTSLDVSANTALTALFCNTNQLTSLNVSANMSLEYLNCGYNQLNSLDVSANTALIFLNCNANQLSSLDVSSNTALTGLNCFSNQLSSLNVSANTALTELRCYSNQLSSLDVSANTALQGLSCKNNQLTSLNVANGNNGASSSSLNVVNALNNPNLTCIQHDTGFDPTTATDWQKDATASWSDNCSSSGGGTSSINENNISFSIVPNPTNRMVKIETDVEISSVKIFSLSGQRVASFSEPTFSIEMLKNGVYFVKVLSDDGSFTTRIIKE